MLISELKSQLHDIFTDNSSVYLYGKSGLGKSKLIHEFVKKEKYEHIYTDIQSLKNDDDFIELLKQNHIMNMFNVKKKGLKKKKLSSSIIWIISIITIKSHFYNHKVFEIHK